MSLICINMFFIETCLIFVCAIPVSQAFDPFVGLLMQDEPCFETIEVGDCNTTISQVFSPKYKGTNTNAANSDFWLFTSRTPDMAEPLHKCGGKLPKNSAFDSAQKTIIIVPGAIESCCRLAWPREYKEQLFMRGNYNVILVDWTWGNFPDPVGGNINAYVVGEQVGFVIKNIMLQNNYADGSKFHIIGHSSGATVANVAGRFIREWDPNRKLRRLTLLEAGPGFKDDDLKHNTSYQEAHFVDVIHSNGGTCFPFFLGNEYPSGHADFYPNGGVFQIACYPEIVTAVSKGDFLYAFFSLLYPSLCSHLQIIQYFKVSINHPAGLQKGAQCDSYEDFLSGACKRCCREDFSKCAVAGFDSEHHFPHKGEPRQVRKYYYELGLVCPYNEDYDFSIYKDC